MAQHGCFLPFSGRVSGSIGTKKIYSMWPIAANLHSRALVPTEVDMPTCLRRSPTSLVSLRPLVASAAAPRHQRTYSLRLRASTGSDRSSSVSGEEALQRAQNLIATAEKLVPFDPSSTNMGLVMWTTLREVPPELRPRLVAGLSSGDIRRLWRLAGLRYGAPSGAVAAAIGPEYSLWRDLPGDSAHISYWRGRAALPTHALGISSFQKAFFQALMTEPTEPDTLFGRVIHPTPVANWGYPGPMYFRAAVGPAVVPATGELCDMTLQYLDPYELGLQSDDIPRSAWPRPRPQRRPFDAGFTDYVRVVGPGMLVGMGYRTRASGSGVPLVPSPLYFAMAFEREENLRE